MVPNNEIKASSPLDETHPQNMTATSFLSSQQIKCGACFLSLFPLSVVYITRSSAHLEKTFMIAKSIN